MSESRHFLSGKHVKKRKKKKEKWYDYAYKTTALFNISLHKYCLQFFFIKQTSSDRSSIMSDPAVVSQQGVVSLPLSVEQLISKIYTEQNKLPPDDGARRGLASLGEDAALDVLRTIASDKIKYSFSGYINYLVKKRNNNNGSPLKRVCFSPPSPQQNRSPVTVTTVRLLNLPQGLGLFKFA